MTPYDVYGPAQFADLFSQKLRAFSASEDPASAPFFYFDGQDPFAFRTPSAALVRLYKDLSPPAKPRFLEGILDFLGSRIDGPSGAALEQVMYAIGSLQTRSLLIPLVRRIGLLAADRAEPREHFVSALMVLKGFGYQSDVVAAAEMLASFNGFPDDLLYEVLELRVTKHEDAWAGVLLEYLHRLEWDRDPGTMPRVRERVEHLAKWLASHVSLRDLQNGVDILLAVDREQLRATPLEIRQDIIGLLVSDLRRLHKQLKVPEAETKESSVDKYKHAQPEMEFMERV